MGAQEWVLLVCAFITLVLTGFGTIVFALMSWSLFQLVRHSAKIAELETNRKGDKEENDRRFHEVKEAIARFERMLRDSLHFGKRHNDTPRS